ncbi:MAG: hypothetical protein DKINENOH_04781 [bacterium]|nr:hypothetical protein [bacterium]
MVAAAGMIKRNGAVSFVEFPMTYKAGFRQLDNSIRRVNVLSIDGHSLTAINPDEKYCDSEQLQHILHDLTLY